MTTKVRIDGVNHLLSADPDEFFGLRMPTKDRTNYFMFERDRGEMPVHRRTGKDQTYYAKKLLTYYEASRANEHIRELDIPNFRVITLTTTRDRVEQMVAAQKDMTQGRGSNLFLFIDDESFLRSNPIDAPWITGKGKVTRLND